MDPSLRWDDVNTFLAVLNIPPLQFGPCLKTIIPAQNPCQLVGCAVRTAFIRLNKLGAHGAPYKLARRSAYMTLAQMDPSLRWDDVNIFSCCFKHPIRQCDPYPQSRHSSAGWNPVAFDAYVYFYYTGKTLANP
ncbi:hypothetical protein H8L32_04695 [Undibacterium sp. CY18W]|uniref:Uncharacterized protein n=1 Tax=Undibacterium hunanense TaxID=2762292 RepID=A0ABR6ZLU4_9BURK|nr:hypothetical protein [Undibacterium hunanense]MBC3916764.1 hypothetical protein [Undibacterium hunanense]